MRNPTTDRLRHDIASGQGGDKVAFPDPAAAPLGTDDEAGGHPPSPGSVAMARRHEIDAAPATTPGTATSERGRTISGEWTDRTGLGGAIAVAVAAVLVTAAIALLA
jgi:hypothetical protein